MTAEAREGLRPLRVAGVRIGVLMGSLAGVLALVNPLLPGSTVEVDAIQYGLGAAALVLAAVMLAAPWDDLFRRPLGMGLLVSWLTANVGLIVIGAVNSGFLGSEAPVFLFLVIVFATIVLPTSGQAFVTGVSVLATVALAVADPDATAAASVTRVGLLVIVALLGNRIGAFLTRQYLAATERHAEAERRALALRAVAEAARGVADLDPDRLLDSVVGAAIDLGFEGANVCLMSDDESTYVVRHPRGHLDAAYTDPDTVHDSSLGMVAYARRARRTVAVDDYADKPDAIPALAALGFRLAVATPIRRSGRLAGVLVAGTTRRSAISGDELEAFDMLGALAGRALENAQLFEAEQEAVHRLERLDQLKSDFVSNVSHELRTPLTVIEGLGATLVDRRDELRPETRDELLERLNANARTLHDIVTRLLDFSRLESGTFEVRREAFELDQCLRDVAARLEAMFDGHALALALEAGPVHVHADPILIERVVENLIVNGLRHTPGGTTLHLRSRREGDAVRVEVGDDGPGIPPDQRAHLLDRFTRGGDPNTRETRGLGLGLALAGEVVALHDSELHIDDDPDGGARFWFRLPVTESG